MPASKAAIDLFFAQRRIAVIGVSRKRAHFSRLVFSAFRERGYDAIPVNPNASEIDGVPAAATLRDVQPAPGAVLVMTPGAPPDIAARAYESGAKVLWLFCAQRREPLESAPSLEVITGECPLMFLPRAGWIHSAHRGLRSLFGQLPT
jgi:hypothetical protein